MRKEPEHTNKKPYSPPEVKVYGTVQELTEKKGLRGAKDGGTFPRTRTNLR